MYRPNFCSECGAKIIRLDWYAWTSRRFCESCARRLRKERLKGPLLAATTLMIIGFVAGRSTRPGPPPLIIERGAISPLYDPSASETGNDDDITRSSAEPPGLNDTQNQEAGGRRQEQEAGTGLHDLATKETVYICGARTKKGAPCSRRVHGAVRCWQHKGMPAMLPPDRLIIKE